MTRYLGASVKKKKAVEPIICMPSVATANQIHYLLKYWKYIAEKTFKAPSIAAKVVKTF